MKKVLENRSLLDEKRMAQLDDAKNDDIYNRLHNNFICRLRQLRTTASG